MKNYKKSIARKAFDKQRKLFYAGDSELFTTIYKLWMPKFVNYAFLKYSAGNADATEAYEEAIAALCYRLHQPTSLSLECKFENYLWGIAKHKLEKMLEYREVNILMEDYPLPEIFVRYVDEITGESESKEINIHNLLRKLSPTDRRLFKFRFYKHYDYASIAGIMKLNADYLKKRYCIIIGKLREMIANNGRTKL